MVLRKRRCWSKWLVRAIDDFGFWIGDFGLTNGADAIQNPQSKIQNPFPLNRRNHKRQGTYLNVILTANAILLTGLLWSQVAGHPLLAAEASAQSSGTAGSPSLIPINAADQRQKQI